MGCWQIRIEQEKAIKNENAYWIVYSFNFKKARVVYISHLKSTVDDSLT